MSAKQDLARLADEWEEALPGRKNGDRRIHSADDSKLVELLRSKIAALPD